MSRTDEKRRDPRVTQRLPVRTQHEGGVELETINLSVGGLFCTSPSFLAPMTRMALALTLPTPSGSPAAVVEGEAVVVRTEPSAPTPAHQGRYRIALFFSRMHDDHRQALKQFLQSRPQ